jgi:hypothetical protein
MVYFIIVLVKKGWFCSFVTRFRVTVSNMSLVVHTRQELAFGKDVFKISSLLRPRGRCAGGGGGRGGRAGTTFRAPDRTGARAPGEEF